jgi:hypothetical protein
MNKCIQLFKLLMFKCIRISTLHPNNVIIDYKARKQTHKMSS